MLNNLIQRGLEHRGLLGADKVESQILLAKNLTKADVLDVARYDAGDVVRFDQTYKRLRVEKDSYLTVEDVERSNGVVLLDHDGRDVRWKPSGASKVEVYTPELPLRVGDLIRWTRNDHANERINAALGRVVAIDRNQHRADVLVDGALHRLDLDRQGHWELAYATTIHAAQGRTADRVLLHLDTSKPHVISHEGWYVGISRARNELRIFTDSIERLPDQIRISLQQESALGAVAREEQSHQPLAQRESEIPHAHLEQVASRAEEHEHRAALHART